MVKHVVEHGELAGYEQDGVEEITGDELLALDCDILVPAALGNVIHHGNVSTIRARIIAEGANSPITPHADRVLNDRGVVILPDILANAGGVTVSYLEWVQDIQNLTWDLEAVRTTLKRTMTTAFAEVWARAQREDTDLRTAATMVGVGRVADAMRMRGLYP